jgi:PKD repeat protein
MHRFRLLEKFNFRMMVLWLVLLAPAFAQAAEVSMFGPETFVRSNGSPVTITNTFSAPLQRDGIIRIQNSLEDDPVTGQLVSSSIITLNGVAVATPNNFNQTVTHLDVPVSLIAGTNVLTVEVRGKPGTGLILETFAFGEAPTAAFTATPNSGPVPVTVSFDASVSTDPDNDIATYSWDFGDGSTGSGVTTSHEYTTPGMLTATLTVTDALGLAGTVTASIEVIDMPRVAPVVFSPDPATGPFQEFVTITLSSATEGATIRFTTDGSNPTPTNSMIFTGPFDLIATATLKAIAVKEGETDSIVTSANYTVDVTPQVEPVTFSPVFQVFPTSMDVTLSTTTPGATIHYTLDGITTPTTASPIFTVPITLTQTTTIMSLAVKPGFIDSPLASTTRTLESDLPFPIPIPPISFSDFDFVELKGRPAHESFLPIAGLPIQGADQMAEARLQGPVDTATFRLVTPAGIEIQPIVLSRPQGSDPLSGLFSGSVQFPNQPFQVAASGLNFDGTPYDVTFSTVFETKTVGFHNVIGPLFLIEGISTLFADLTNHGSSGIFSVTATDDQGFISSFTPSSITLGTGETGLVQVDILVPLGTPETTEVNVSLAVTNTTNPEISNTANASFLVVIFPTITPPADITTVATSTLTPVDIGTATATDNFGIHSITNNAPTEGFPVGTTEVTWTAKDTGGNNSSAIQTVTITAP